MSSSTPSSRSYLYLMIAILGWGLSTPFIEFGLPYISPLPFLATRFLLATLILTPFLLVYKRAEFIDLLHYKWTWIVGFSEAIGLITQYLGQDLGVPSGLSALLSLCFLLIVPFLSPLFLDERINWLHGLAIVIGFIGIIFISTNGDLDNLRNGGTNILGIFLLITAAFGYAFYIVSTSRLSTVEYPKLDTFSLFYAVLLIVAFASSITTVAFSSFEPIVNQVWIWLILLTIFSTLVAFFTYFIALKEISANTASVLLLLQVIVPFAVDYLFLTRRYGFWVIIGIILILLAILLVVAIPFLNDEKT